MSEEHQASPRALRQAVKDAKREILLDMGQAASSTSKIMPCTVSSFSELHDYVDANEYAGFTDDDRRAHWSTDDLIALQDEVHEWLASGQAMEEKVGMTLYLKYGEDETPRVSWFDLTKKERRKWKADARTLIDDLGLDAQ